ncbi:MAG: hypothetical protein A2Y12_13085, partial [Planctomycetes bacterium GWF2_42_9]
MFTFKMTKIVATSIIVLILAGYSQAMTLVSQWQFNDGSGTIATDTARYSSYLGSKGELSGTTNWGTDYFSFNGSSHFRVSRKSNNFLIDMSKTFYLCATIRSSQSNGCIVGRSNQQFVPGAKGFGIYGGRLYFSCGWVADIFGNANVADGQWHDVGVSFNADTGVVYLYADGATDATSGAFNEMVTYNDNFDLFLGVQCTLDSGWLNHFSGDIKNVRIYNYELNAYAPYPYNRTDILMNPSTNQLQWSTPDASMTYDVYFSTEQELVENGNSSVRVSTGQGGTTYSVSLVNGRRYFWRIDSKLNGNTYPGNVWTFVSSNQADTGSSTYYVATNGSDLNAGTSTNAPFATIQKARDKIGIDILNGATGDKTVYIRDGKYFLDSGIIFDSWASGKNTQIISFKNYSGEAPIIVGGKTITGWTLDSGSIYKASVGTNQEFYCLFENGNRSTMARNPNRGLYNTVATGYGSKTVFGYAPGEYTTFDCNNAQVYLWPGLGDWNWSSITVPISVNFGTRAIYIYPASDFNIPAGNRYYLQGAKEFLDQAGEFYLNPSTGYLYYQPVSTPISSQEIVAPTTKNVVKICGTSELDVAGNITFEGITFTISDFNECYYIRSVNDEEDVHQGLIQIENAKKVTIKNCKIKNAGFAGVMLDKYSQNNTIYGNQITDIGYHGVYLSGWNLGDGGWDIGEAGFIDANSSYVNKNNIIQSNFIVGCGKLCGHGTGIYLNQSGDNEISYNTIRFCSSRAIAVQGKAYLSYMEGLTFYYTTVTADNYYSFIHSRNNSIKFNDVANCFYDTQDVGLFYTQSAGKDNILNNNILHDSYVSISGGYAQGIYLDDQSGYWIMQNNIVYGISANGGNGVSLVCKGVYNTLTNNILVDSDYSSSSLNLGDAFFWAMSGVPNDHITSTKNIFYQAGGQWVYYFNDWQDDPSRMLKSENNTFYHPSGSYGVYGIPGDDTFAVWKTLFSNKYDQNSVTSDPLFSDRFKHDYTVTSSSPSLSLGFSNIDTSKVGLDPNYSFKASLIYPAGRFLLDEQSGATAYDSSGNNNNGTANGTITWAGDGLKFNGSSTYIDIADRSYYACNQPFSWSAWIRTSGTSEVIIARDQLSQWTTGAKELYVDANGKLAFSVGWVGTVSSPAKVNDNQWHHVAVVYSSSLVKLYCDGKVVVTGSLNLDTATDSGFTIKIGIQNTGSGYFNGTIGRVEFHNGALTDSNIENIYFDNFVSRIPPMAGCWVLNETSESTAYDSSGINNRGTVNGAVSWTDNSLYFNGSSTYVDIPNHSGYACNVPFTWSVWIKTSGTSDVIIARDQLSQWTTGAKELYIDSNGKLAFSVGWVGTVSSTATVNDNQWHHVAVIYNGAYVQLYKDGTPVVSGAMSLSGATDTGFTMKLGIQNTGVGLFNGYMKKVCIFSRSLTAAEIKSLYLDYLVLPSQASSPSPSSGAT